MAAALCHKLIHRINPSGLLYHTSTPRCGYKLANNLKDCYSVLRVTPESEDHEVRQAYIDLAKRYHPDSGSKLADPNKFTQVENAYRTVMNHRSKAKEEEEEVPTTLTEERFSMPQHRQYLSYEGVGFGAPSKRYKQYQQVRVQRASDNVYEYKVNKEVHTHETALVTKDKQETRKRTIRNAIDRLVEDLVQESLAKGEFENLPGKGKPIDFSEHNPYVDTHTHNINKILINNGYVPEWVILAKEIRADVEKAKERAWELRMKAGPEPVSKYFKQKLDHEFEGFREVIKEANRKIDKFNMIVPTMRQQKCHYNGEKMLIKMLDEYREKLESGEIVHEDPKFGIEYEPLDPKGSGNVKNWWNDIKALFSPS